MATIQILMGTTCAPEPRPAPRRYNTHMPKVTFLDIYRLLDKSNCRECGEPSCMAFAHAVVKGGRKLPDCPHLDPARASQALEGAQWGAHAEGFQQSIEALRKEVGGIGLNELARATGGVVVGGRLVIRSLGKDFHISPDATVESICHVNRWIEMLLMSYCKSAAGARPTGRWASFGALDGAATRAGYFSHRCEEPLRALADAHTAIFFELLDLFGAETSAVPPEGSDRPVGADRSVVLRPLPRFPVMISYWADEEGMGSSLQMLFDSGAQRMLPLEAIIALCRGMLEMFRKIIHKHQECSSGTLSL